MLQMQPIVPLGTLRRRSWIWAIALISTRRFCHLSSNKKLLSPCSAKTSVCLGLADFTLWRTSKPFLNKRSCNYRQKCRNSLTSTHIPLNVFNGKSYEKTKNTSADELCCFQLP